MVRRVTFTVSLILLFSLPNLNATVPNPWRILSRPTTRDLTKLFFLDSLTGFVAGRQGTIVKTTDGGRTWLPQTSNINTDIIDVYMLNDRYGWALSYVSFVDTTAWYGAIFLKTTNGGESWLNEQFPVKGIYLNSVRFLDSLHGWVGGQSGTLLETSDGGTSWHPAAVDSSFFANLTISKIRFYSPSYGFAVGGRLDLSGVVWRTTNGGQRWIAKSVSPEPVLDIHRIDSLNIIGVVGDLEYGAGFIRTADGGENWEYETLNIFGQPTSLSFRTTTEVWSPLGFVQRLMYTKDAGTTWSTVKTPGQIAVFDLVFTDSTTGYAVGDAGAVLKYSPLPVSVEEEDPLTPPLTPKLSQNYPNPFNPKTIIKFGLPTSSASEGEASTNHVTLKVFDVLGREVASLVNENLKVGRYEATFDAATFSSGTHF
jgi:photosystem II stability/assembly factor-like uncharacterized protein